MPTPFSIILFTILLSSMISSIMADDELVFDLSPFIKVYKDGRIERNEAAEAKVPPSLDLKTGVQSKDIIFSQKNSISARLYLPNSTPNKKLPLVVYFHGGAFCIASAATPIYHNYLNLLASAANVVVVSVDYRLAPEHPLPIAYEDSWAAVKWVASQCGGKGREEWLNRHVDFHRVFFAGDSAGANIAHNMGLREGALGLKGTRVIGVILVNPFFWGTKPVGRESTLPQRVKFLTETIWRLVYPSSSGSDDPHFNPTKDPKLRELGCEKVLVSVAELDPWRDRGLYYVQSLKRSGWKGTVKVVKSKGVGHVFHLVNSTNQQAVDLMKNIVYFLN